MRVRVRFWVKNWVRVRVRVRYRILNRTCGYAIDDKMIEKTLIFYDNNNKRIKFDDKKC